MKYIMNKLTKTIVVILSLVAITVFLTSTQANAGDIVKGKSSKLSAQPFEWTPLDNPNTRCEFISENKVLWGLCYDIEK